MNWLFDNKDWIFNGVGVTLLIGSVTFLSNYMAKRLAAKKNKSSSQFPQIVDINEFDLLKKLITEATEIKIFSSSAESYRTRLNIILKEIKIEKKKTIKILIRDNESDYRNGEIVGEMKKWKQDIEIATNNMISVEFKRYVHKVVSVMLRGYIFDNNYAVLGSVHIKKRQQ